MVSREQILMRTKLAAYLLLLFLVSAEVEDAWGIAPVSSTVVSLAEEDDEYLPAKPLEVRVRAAERHQPVFSTPKCTDGNSSSSFACTTTEEATIAAPHVLPPLYVLMSLQR
jgi:hypothetical protein